MKPPKIEEKLYNRSLRFLSFRARSEKEVTDYLAKITKKKSKNYSTVIIPQIIKKLKQLNLINDVDFSRWWIDQRQNLNPKGKKVLALELKHKGVSQEIIDRRISQISPISQIDSARKILAKKNKLYGHLPRLQLKKKLFSFLLRRGFDYQLSCQVIDEALKK